MKRLLFAATALLAMAACNNANNQNSNADSTSMNGDSSTATTATSDTAWTPLFNGNSLSNWHDYGKNAPDNTWQVDSNTIHLVPKKGEGGDLVTNDTYGNFDLKLQWKISKGGNSGILFYVQEDTSKYKESYFTGPEMQVLDNNGHPDAKIIKHRAGDLYDLITSKPETVKPVGEWNDVEIRSQDSTLTFWLNGTQVVTTKLWDDNWKKMVAGSKFKQWPDFGTFKEGHIALQNHGNEVWFRNIEIRKL
jgi:hypothetical protein